MHTPDLFQELGARQWLAILPGEVRGAMSLSLILLFGIFCLRAVLKKDWLVAPIGALLFALSQHQVATSASWWVAEYLGFVAAYSALAFVLLRMGLVTTISCLVFADLLGDVMLGTDFTAWYAGSGIATVALILIVGLLAF